MGVYVDTVTGAGRGLCQMLTADRAAFGHGLAGVPQWVVRSGGGAP